MQQPVSEETYRDFLKTFQAFRDPAGLMISPLLTSPLVRAQLQSQASPLPHQALQATFTTILELVAAENPAYADLLRGRFWEGQQIEEMLTAERPLPMSKRTFSNYQRNAIQTFAFLFLQAENSWREQQPTAITAMPPGEVVIVPTPSEEVDHLLPLSQRAAQPVAVESATEQAAGAPLSPTRVPLVVDAQVKYRKVITLPMAPQRRPLWLVGGVLLLLLLAGIFLRERMTAFWVAATTATMPLLFADDFENGAGKWHPNRAGWALQADESGNHFYCVRTDGPYTYALAGNTTWQDYILQLEMKIVQSAPGGSANVLWRVAEPASRHYLLGIVAEADGGGLKLAREDPAFLLLDHSLHRLPTGVWTPIRIEVAGDQSQVFVGADSLPALQTSDPSPIPQGGIGLSAGFDQGTSSSMWEICFDNIQVIKK